jgi:hypothetical protein
MQKGESIDPEILFPVSGMDMLLVRRGGDAQNAHEVKCGEAALV